MSVKTLMSGASTDFSAWEAGGGHNGGMGAALDTVNPNNVAADGTAYGGIGDAARSYYPGNAKYPPYPPGHPELDPLRGYPAPVTGNRLFIDSAMPALFGVPGNRGVRCTVHVNDGIYVTGNPDNNITGGDATRFQWGNLTDPTYNGGPYNGLSRAAWLPFVIAGGGRGFGNSTLGEERRFGFWTAIPASWPTQTSGWMTIGPEWHHNFGLGPAPHLGSLDVLYDRFMMSVNGGPAGVYDPTTIQNDPRAGAAPNAALAGYGWPGAYTNVQIYFDFVTGFLGAVRGPDGGGYGSYTMIVDGPWGTAGTVVLTTVRGDPLNPNSPDPRDYAPFNTAATMQKDARYDWDYHYIVSDRYAVSGDPWNPVCPVRGLFEAWGRMYYNGSLGPWVKVCPTLRIATYYSIVDNRDGRRKSPGAWLLMGSYRRYVPGAPDATHWWGDVKIGDASSTAADVSMDGTDPNNATPPTPPAKTSDPILDTSDPAQVGVVQSITVGVYTGAGLTITRQWYRYDPDGTNEVLIPTETGTTYIYAVADLGKIVRCKELAANTAGSIPGFTAFSGEVTATPASGASPSVLASAFGHVNGTSLAISVNIPAGTKELLVAIADVHLFDLAALHPVKVSSGAGTVDLTLVPSSEKSSGSLADVEWFALANPPTGAQIVTITNNSFRGISAAVVCVDVVTSVLAAQVRGSANPITTGAVTTVAADLLVAAVSQANPNGTTPTATNAVGQTGLGTDIVSDGANQIKISASWKKAVGVSTTLDWTQTGSGITNNVSVLTLRGSAPAIVPVNTVAPTISGTPRTGFSLTADPGTNINDPFTNLTYSWETDASGTYLPIAGPAEPNQAYAIRTPDEGHNVRCHMVLANAAGSVDLYTAGLLIVPPTPLAVASLNIRYLGQWVPVQLTGV